LRCILGRFTVLLQKLADTVPVIAHGRQRVPLKLAAGSTSLVELAYPTLAPSLPLEAPRPRIHAEVGRYRVRLAQSNEDRAAACRLRFRVFNIELGEGLESSYQTGLDSDRFDDVCEHLLVEDKSEDNPGRRIVGTYRMQSGITAERNLGYYSEQEFSFAPYEPLRPGILELGRASIDREHRTPEVLTLLWRGIAQYAKDMGLRYLIGCSSLTSRNPVEGWQMYGQLEHYRVSPEFETAPTAAYACPTEQEGAHAQPSPFLEAIAWSSRSREARTTAWSGSSREARTTAWSGSSREARTELTALAAGKGREDGAPVQVTVPKLLKTYLAIGARIGGPPAWDREFGTIDFLTLLDLKLLSSSARNRFLAPLTQ
jgi:putative hemolysin